MQHRRSIAFDLNRAFRPRNREGHEAGLAKLLASELDEADYVLDLHSTSAASPVFGAGANTAQHRDFCGALDVGLFSFGWSEPRSHSMLIDEADRRNAVGLLVECGQHALTNTANVALRCGIRAMEWVGLVDHTGIRQSPTTPQAVRVSEIVTAESEPLQMTRAFQNFELVRQGTEVCRGEARSWIAPRDFVILIPAQKEVKVGEDAFAVGTTASE